jgi:hypothetical protein
MGSIGDPETSVTTNQRSVTSQKSDDPIPAPVEKLERVKREGLPRHSILDRGDDETWVDQNDNGDTKTIL